MKVVYFISSYRSPEQLFRLLRTLRQGDPDGQFLIHHDAFGTPLPPDAPELVGTRLVSSDHPMVWGDLTLEAVRWRAFRTILAELDFDHVVLLSEQDYPVAPLRELHRYLADGGWDVVADAEPVQEAADPADREEFRRRYGYRYAVLPQPGLSRLLPARARRVQRRVLMRLYSETNRRQSWLRFYHFPPELGLPTRLGIRRSPDFRPGFRCWYNAAWYVLSRDAVQAVVRFLDENPRYVQHVARTIIPLESATISITMNDPHLRVSTTPVHFARFSDPASGRPDELGEADLAGLTDGHWYFARKFPDDPHVLDLLDRRVLATTPTDPTRPTETAP